MYHEETHKIPAVSHRSCRSSIPVSYRTAARRHSPAHKAEDEAKLDPVCRIAYGVGIHTCHHTKYNRQCQKYQINGELAFFIISGRKLSFITRIASVINQSKVVSSYFLPPAASLSLHIPKSLQQI